MTAAAQAAGVFAAAVMPALFPLLVLAELSGRCPKRNSKCSPFGKTCRLQSLRLLLFSFGAGSPAGTRRIALDHETNRPWLLVASGVMSPMFFVGTLATWLNDSRAALLMLLAHWISALMTGLFVRVILLKRDGSSAVEATPREASWGEALPASIAAACRALLSVCGAMMLYAVIGAVLSELLRLCWPQVPAQWLAVLHGLLEIGGGSHAVCEAFDAPYALLCALCSFGGLSLWTQNLAFIGRQLRPAALLAFRAVHGALAYGVFTLLWFCFGGAAETAAISPASAPLPSISLPACLALLLLWAASWQKSKTCWPHN